MASVSSISGIRISTAVRGLRPNRSREGIMAECSARSRVVRFTQTAAATYSSHLVGQDLRGSDSTSCTHAPAFSTLPSPLGWSVGPNSIGTFNHRHKFPPPSARVNKGTPNVRLRSRRNRATPCTSFDGSG